MATRIYLMPMIGAGTDADSRRAKYADTLLAGLTVATMDGGAEAACLVAVVMPADAGTAAALHASLVANADVTAVPADLDQQIGGSLAAVKAAMESLNVPAGWVQSTFTYRTVLRVVAALFQFQQRLQATGTGTTIFGGGVTLDSTFGSLPAATRTRLQNAAISLGYDTSSLTGASTLRQCLKAMADQWRAIDSILFGGEVF